jgi:hypothetical protein
MEVVLAPHRMASARSCAVVVSFAVGLALVCYLGAQGGHHLICPEMSTPLDMVPRVHPSHTSPVRGLLLENFTAKQTTLPVIREGR